MKKLLRKITTIAMVAVGLSMSGCGSKGNTSIASKETVSEEATQSKFDEARKTPFGKYPETIEYTLGKLTGANNSNMPQGDTYENNAYTRFIKSLINVQNVDVFESMDEQYDYSVSTVIQSGNIPDIMVVSSYNDLQTLYEYGLIADLSDAYKNCISDRIKDIYASYGDEVIDSVTFDGKIMAIPETNITDGPNLVWLRKDWMDKLGLSEPKTIYDVEKIVKEFVEKDPGNNGKGNTIGIASVPSLYGGCGYSSEYLLDIVFAQFGAYPKQWIYNSNNDVVYGSVQSEAKDALEYINHLYETGVLDKNFLLRTSSNIIELIDKGLCGSFFGPWWAPNNPLMSAMEHNPQANWQPYLLQTDNDGSTSYHTQNPTYKYIVVRKGFEYPEVACKIVSVLFDYIRYEEKDNIEFIKYYQDNVDPTARPFAINIDYNDALVRCYSEITSVINGNKNANDLLILEYSYLSACEDYLKNSSAATPENWAAYTSRITACSLLDKHDIKKVQSLFFRQTKTMESNWWKLEELEKETYLKIVTGEMELDEFDSFVKKWNSNGGNKITNEVRAEVNK